MRRRALSTQAWLVSLVQVVQNVCQTLWHCPQTAAHVQLSRTVPLRSYNLNPSGSHVCRYALLAPRRSSRITMASGWTNSRASVWSICSTTFGTSPCATSRTQRCAAAVLCPLVLCPITLSASDNKLKPATNQHSRNLQKPTIISLEQQHYHMSLQQYVVLWSAALPCCW